MTESSIEDIVKAYGYLTLGTRFRRMGEALQAQTQALLAEHGMDMPAAHFPLLAALDWHGPLSVSELSQAVGVSQPVVTRSLHGLQAQQLVESAVGEDDRRVRRVALSAQGQALVRRARTKVWPLVEASVAHACEGLAGPLLEQIAGLEAALAQQTLPQRAALVKPSPSKPARKRQP